MPRKRPLSSSKTPAKVPASRPQLGEFARIARLKLLFSKSKQALVKVAIGDDAAVLRPCRGEMVWTIDSSVEGVHFRRAWLDEKDIGWRSFNAAASDLAAMGASPIAALSALELPRRFSDSALLRLVEGQQQAAAALECPIIGGNFASADVVSVTTTLLGQATRSLLRSGARVGDELWLVGEVGLAAAGLACLEERTRQRRGTAVDRCVSAWRRPRALIERGRALVGKAHAVIDISDGLVGDACHIAESSGVAIELDMVALDELLEPELRAVASKLSRSALEFALHGGEDYALLATGSRSMRPLWAKSIGRVVAGEGLWWLTNGVKRRPVKRGFEHFG